MFRLGVLLALAVACLSAEEWTRFRGPNGSGISADSGFPVEFGKDKNLVWRTVVRPGKSSPVLTKTRIFLTAFENGKLYTMALDRASGKLLWERSEVRRHAQDVQQLNQPAAITPVTDGENVYVFFKDFGLLAYNGDGKPLWRAPLGPFTNTQGLGASPILAGDLVILQIDQVDNSYLAAYSTRNGELRWKIARQENEAWATPLLFQPPGEAPVIVTAGAGQLGVHRVSDGKRISSYPEASPAMVASPVIAGNTVYAFGYGADSASPFSRALARFDKNKDGKITPDEYGDDSLLISMATYMGNRDGILDEEKWVAWGQHVAGYTGLFAVPLDTKSTTLKRAWRTDKGFANVVPSPLIHDGILYSVKNGGILSAYDTKTGELLKTGRVTGALGGYSSSPVFAEGRIYLASEEGKIAVVRPGRDWEVIRVNEIGDGFFATPALSAGRMYARGAEALYCFGGGGR